MEESESLEARARIVYPFDSVLSACFFGVLVLLLHCLETRGGLLDKRPLS